MFCRSSRPPVPSLRERRSGGTIWSASCGFRDFRETLRGGFRGNAHSPAHAGAGDVGRRGGCVGAATPDHRSSDVGRDQRAGGGRRRLRHRHRVRRGDERRGPLCDRGTGRRRHAGVPPHRVQAARGPGPGRSEHGGRDPRARRVQPRGGGRDRPGDGRRAAQCRDRDVGHHRQRGDERAGSCGRSGAAGQGPRRRNRRATTARNRTTPSTGWPT